MITDGHDDWHRYRNRIVTRTFACTRISHTSCTTTFMHGHLHLAETINLPTFSQHTQSLEQRDSAFMPMWMRWTHQPFLQPLDVSGVQAQRCWRFRRWLRDRPHSQQPTPASWSWSLTRSCIEQSMTIALRVHLSTGPSVSRNQVYLEDVLQRSHSSGDYIATAATSRAMSLVLFVRHVS